MSGKQSGKKGGLAGNPPGKNRALVDLTRKKETLSIVDRHNIPISLNANYFPIIFGDGDKKFYRYSLTFTGAMTPVSTRIQRRAIACMIKFRIRDSFVATDYNALLISRTKIFGEGATETPATQAPETQSPTTQSPASRSPTAQKTASQSPPAQKSATQSPPIQKTDLSLHQLRKLYPSLFQLRKLYPSLLKLRSLQLSLLKLRILQLSLSQASFLQLRLLMLSFLSGTTTSHSRNLLPLPVDVSLSLSNSEGSLISRMCWTSFSCQAIASLTRKEMCQLILSTPSSVAGSIIWRLVTLLVQVDLISGALVRIDSTDLSKGVILVEELCPLLDFPEAFVSLPNYYSTSIVPQELSTKALS